MSPIMQARLQRFKQNKLGFGCFIVFIIIFVLSLAAELIANDKPLLIRYEQSLYLPVFKAYPETTFGGVFETEADYKDPVVQQLIADRGWAVWPLIEFSYQTPNLDLTVPVPSAPTAQNWLGTDDQGRDVLARILYGLRVSLLFGFALTFASAALGIFCCAWHYRRGDTGLLWRLGRFAGTADSGSLGWFTDAVHGDDFGQHVYPKCVLAICNYAAIWLDDTGWLSSGRVFTRPKF